MSGLSAALCERNQVSQQPLAKLTTMRVGGLTTLVELMDLQDVPELRERGALWLGKGANIVAGDAPLTVPVVRLGDAFAGLEFQDKGDQVRARVGAGHDLAAMISACIQAGLAGPETLAGVPASVGGALFMNAGTAHAWIGDLVDRVQVLLPQDREPVWLSRGECPAAYRDGGIPDGGLVLGAELLLRRGEPEELQQRARDLKKAKAANQPLAARSAGCVFTNPDNDLTAGRLLDQLGCKGWREGGAEVSAIHANFIVNAGTACGSDVFRLIRRLRLHAWREQEVALRIEVRTWQAPDDLRAHPEEMEPCDSM